MKIFGLIVLVLTGLNLYGQTSMDRKKENSAHLKAKLSLTDQQWDQLRQINEQFMTRQARLRNDTSLTRTAIQAERKKLAEERNAGVQKILTKEQRARWDSLRKAEHTRTSAHRKRSDFRDEMKEAVGLSDDAMKKIMEINRSMGADLRVLRSDTAATHESREEAKRAIIKNRNEKIEKMLSKEQYGKFLEYESENRRLHIRQGRKGGAGHPAGPGRHRR